MHGLHGVVIGFLESELDVLGHPDTTLMSASLEADTHLDSLIFAHSFFVEHSDHAFVVLDKRVRLVFGQSLLKELMHCRPLLLV